MFKGVIFDLDGVLIDSEPLHVEATNRVLKKFGFSLTEEENRPFEGLRENEYWLALKKRFGIDEKADKLINEENEEMWKILKERKLKPREGVLELLKYLKDKGFKLAVASSSPKKQVEYMLESMGILELLDVVIGGDEVDRGKPDPEIFLKTAELLKLKPDEILVVEDSINGIEGAKRAGMDVIPFGKWNNGVKNFSELRRKIEEELLK